MESGSSPRSSVININVDLHQGIFQHPLSSLYLFLQNKAVSIYLQISHHHNQFDTNSHRKLRSWQAFYFISPLIYLTVEQLSHRKKNPLRESQLIVYVISLYVVRRLGVSPNSRLFKYSSIKATNQRCEPQLSICLFLVFLFSKAWCCNKVMEWHLH